LNLVDTFLKLISIESETGKEDNILDFIETFLEGNNFQGEIKRNNGGILLSLANLVKKLL
jgi:di/tripeptidase